MKLIIARLAAVVLVGACAKTSVVPLAANEVQVTASAAPACGRTGAQEVAIKTAAIETLGRGFDGFVVLGGDYQDSVRVVGTTPQTAYTTGSATAYGTGSTVSAYGQSTTSVYGGQPVWGGRHDQVFVLRMLHADDADFSQAVDARSVLGPDWQEQVTKGAPNSC